MAVKPRRHQTSLEIPYAFSQVLDGNSRTRDVRWRSQPQKSVYYVTDENQFQSSVGVQNLNRKTLRYVMAERRHYRIVARLATGSEYVRQAINPHIRPTLFGEALQHVFGAAFATSVWTIQFRVRGRREYDSRRTSAFEESVTKVLRKAYVHTFEVIGVIRTIRPR